MTETWFAWCVRRPGPPSKQGYSFAPSRRLDQIAGEVKHSAEGGLAAAFAELDRVQRRASWHFTVAADGTVYQHYPLESICWHAGVAGDLRTDSSILGNALLVGVEHVDRDERGEYAVLRPEQVTATSRLSLEIRRVCPRYGAMKPELRRNLWEHRWVSATACPSGLIPWPNIIAEIERKEMENMPLTDGDLAQIGEIVRRQTAEGLIRDPRDGRVYHFALGMRGHIASPGMFDAAGFDWGEVRDLPADAIDAIPTVEDVIRRVVRSELSQGVIDHLTQVLQEVVRREVSEKVALAVVQELSRRLA